MNYVEYRIAVESEDSGDVAVALICELGFESFMLEEPGSQLCYIPANLHPEFAPQIEQILVLHGYQYTVSEIVAQNWNAAWENDFEPIVVGDSVCVRAPHHPLSQCQNEVIIEPNMSFGTGHHPTTYMMLQALGQLTVGGKMVLDAGCGSGVLGIYAAKLGASGVVGFDIDQWSVDSALQNVQNNCLAGCDVHILATTAEDINGQFDIILANINRNVLVAEMQNFARLATPGALLLLSGFLESDLSILRDCAALNGFVQTAENQRDGWYQLTFQKQ